MKIARLNIYNGKSESKILAHCDVETSEGIVIKNFRLINGPSGIFLASPNLKGKDGKYYDTVYFPKDLKNEIQTIAIEEYNKQKKTTM